MINVLVKNNKLIFTAFGTTTIDIINGQLIHTSSFHNVLLMFDGLVNFNTLNDNAKFLIGNTIVTPSRSILYQVNLTRQNTVNICVTITNYLEETIKTND